MELFIVIVKRRGGGRSERKQEEAFVIRGWIYMNFIGELMGYQFVRG